MNDRHRLSADRPGPPVIKAPADDRRAQAELERLAELGHGLIADEPVRTIEEQLDDEAAPWLITGVRPFGLFDTIIVFDAVDAQGGAHTFGCDHRPARDIRAALEAGEDVYVKQPPSWALLG